MNQRSPLSGSRNAAYRWRRRLVIGAVIAAAGLACYLGRGPLLRAAAGLLISEDAGESADVVLPLGDAREFAEAARLCRSGRAAGVLLIPARPDFAQRLGVLPTDEALMRRELARAGVGDEIATTVLGQAGNDWSRFRQLGAWLADHPEMRVRLVSGRLQSARCRHILLAVLPKEAARVRLEALARPEYDETNWWSRKEGLLDVCNGWMGYSHILLCGEDEEKPQWDPDQYEQNLR